MYKHILIPTDGSERSSLAVQHGIELARAVSARVTVVIATPTFLAFGGDPFMPTGMPAEYRQQMASEAQGYLSAAAGAAKSAGVPCETVHVEQDAPYRAIIDTAAQRGCDLIVMASHGRRGVGALVLGSETNKVLTHSKIPVLVYR